MRYRQHRPTAHRTRLSSHTRVTYSRERPGTRSACHRRHIALCSTYTDRSVPYAPRLVVTQTWHVPPWRQVQLDSVFPGVSSSISYVLQNSPPAGSSISSRSIHSFSLASTAACFNGSVTACWVMILGGCGDIGSPLPLLPFMSPWRNDFSLCIQPSFLERPYQS